MNSATSARAATPSIGTDVTAREQYSEGDHATRIHSGVPPVLRMPLQGGNSLDRLRAERQILQRLAAVIGVPRLVAGPQPSDDALDARWALRGDRPR